MANEITVVIASKAKHGKSTVAQIISRALHEKGIKVRLFDDNKPALDSIDERVAAVAKNTEVIIKTVAVSRSLHPTAFETGT